VAQIGTLLRIARRAQAIPTTRHPLEEGIVAASASGQAIPD
jgi:hypothetical protein